MRRRSASCRQTAIPSAVSRTSTSTPSAPPVNAASTAAVVFSGGPAGQTCPRCPMICTVLRVARAGNRELARKRTAADKWGTFRPREDEAEPRDPIRLDAVPMLRVSLAQVDAVVGDLAGNADLVLRWCRHAADRGAHLVAFPEMVLTGYPAEDLVLRRSFIDASLRELAGLPARLAADGLADLAVVVGYLDRRPDALPRIGRPAGEPQNAVALLHGGQVVARYAKHHLPNYGVFDEYRYFVPGSSLPIVRLHGIDIAMTICEDLWQDGGPVKVATVANAGLLLCVNGSPYERSKDDTRLALAQRRAVEAGAPLAYVNLVGGQDELVFDGDSLVVDATGRLLARSVAGSPIRSRRTPRSTARWSPRPGTTRGRTASPRWSSGSPAASTPHWSPRSPAMRSGRRPCTWSVCRAGGPRTTPSPTPRNSPAARAWLGCCSRSRRWWTPTPPSWTCTVWPRRTCRPGCVARC